MYHKALHFSSIPFPVSRGGILALLFACSGIAASWGQEVEFTATAKTNLQVGEQFRVIYSLNVQATDFSGPDFEGFRVLSGPNPSTNQSYQIVNGQVSQSFQLTYTYYLQTTKEGLFPIPPAVATVKGKKYTSNPLQLSVTQATSTPPPPSGQSPQGRSQGSRIQGGTKDDVFIRAVADKQNPYQGEQVIVTYKIYTQIPISQINITKLSTFQGFWATDLMDQKAQLKQYTEVIGGKEYVVADLRKIALYAQRSGDLRIDPMEMECLAQVKTDRSGRLRDPFFDSFFDDPFFNRNYENVELSLSSNALNIKVKPLPSERMPDGFGGAVGTFTLKSEADRTTLKANEPISLKITISGKGNLELIEGLPMNFPPDFETYDPKISSNLNKNASGVSGSRVFEYLVIPRNAGRFEIKPIPFSFFDPARKSYQTLHTQAFSFNVGKGDNESSGVNYSGVSQKDIQFIGSDIRHIRPGQISLRKSGDFFFFSPTFFLWLFVPLFAFIAIVVYVRSMRKRKGDTVLMKNLKATKVARKNLKKAAEYLKNGKSDEFHEEISRALWGYISNKFNIPLAELSIDNVSQRLAVKKISADSIGELTGVLDKCEFARFAPGDKSKNMQDAYDSALQMISKIEGELK